MTAKRNKHLFAAAAPTAAIALSGGCGTLMHINDETFFVAQSSGMPAASNKTDLLAVFDKDLAKLRKTLDGVNEAKASLSTPDDDATIKGVIAHRTHWMGMFHGWYEDGAAGREVHVPAKGYKWNQLKEYNAPLYARGNETPWAVLQADFETACDKFRHFIAAQDEDALYADGVHAWTGKWTLGRYAEASGPSHFRSANAYIRKVLRNAK